MFGELPKLFDRNFVTGYLLPMMVFLAASLELTRKFHFFANNHPLARSQFLDLTPALGLLLLVGGMVLLVLNREIVRFFEGYGKFNPFKLLHGFEQRRFALLQQELAEVNTEYKRYTATGHTVPDRVRVRRREIMEQLAIDFPDDPLWLLPTAFGNAIRAYEVYPRVMYGIESIQAWSRLNAVLTDDFDKNIDTAKSQTDFWVNVWLLGLLLLVEYIVLVAYYHTFPVPWIPALALGGILIGCLRAKQAAIVWGEWVKASFDVHLPELASKMNLSVPDDREEARRFWQRYSQAIIYRLPEQLPERKALGTAKAETIGALVGDTTTELPPPTVQLRTSAGGHSETTGT
jgi:hypothetical protein